MKPKLQKKITCLGAYIKAKRIRMANGSKRKMVDSYKTMSWFSSCRLARVATKQHIRQWNEFNSL